jgi:hypothetical protein
MSYHGDGSCLETFQQMLVVLQSQINAGQLRLLPIIKKCLVARYNAKLSAGADWNDDAHVPPIVSLYNLYMALKSPPYNITRISLKPGKFTWTLTRLNGQTFDVSGNATADQALVAKITALVTSKGGKTRRLRKKRKTKKRSS